MEHEIRPNIQIDLVGENAVGKQPCVHNWGPDRVLRQHGGDGLGVVEIRPQPIVPAAYKSSFQWFEKPSLAIS